MLYMRNHGDHDKESAAGDLLSLEDSKNELFLADIDDGEARRRISRGTRRCILEEMHSDL